MDHILYILVGPKGSGKTYIGDLIERELGIPFMRVEPIFKRLRRDREITDAEYIREGFSVVEGKLRTLFEESQEIIIETTGTADEFWRMTERLSDLCSVVRIRLDVPLDLCLERVRTRDASLHIPVSDEQVEWINRLALEVDYASDLVLANVGMEDREIVEMFCSVREE